MSKSKRLFLWSFLPSILLIIIYLCVYKFLPSQAIQHIDINNHITMGDKKIYLYLMFIPLLISLLATWISFINHKKSDERYKRVAVNIFISPFYSIKFYKCCFSNSWHAYYL